MNHTLKSDALSGKVGLVLGIANKRSIAFDIADQITKHGGGVAVTYLKDEYKKKVEPLASDIGASHLLYCNVLDTQSVDSAVSTLEKSWGKIDYLIHSIAFSEKNELQGEYIDTSLDNFLNAMNVSCYSFTMLAKKVRPLMEKNGGSLITMSYLGAEKVVPNYNVMGLCKAALESSVRYLAADLGSSNIRVNAISAGPIRTLAASAIGEFQSLLDWTATYSPLKRATTLQDVSGTALFLISDMSSGITGQTIYVDSGYNIVGIPDKRS